MDSALPSVTGEPPATDWSLLPHDALASVFVRLGAVDVLMGAGLVCRSWLDAANLPDVWRVVDMDDILHVMAKAVVFSSEGQVREFAGKLRAVAMAAVDRSNGQLREFAGNAFVTGELLKYIVESSPSLNTLRRVYCKPLASVIKESPLLELRSLELEDIHLTEQELTTVLDKCPLLQVLRMHAAPLFQHPLSPRVCPAREIRRDQDDDDGL